MLQQEYEPIKEGMEVSCSGRLARRSALDSFDPGTWQRFKRCVLVEPALGEPKKKESRAKFLEHLHHCFYSPLRLHDHRRYCSTCLHLPGKETHAWGLSYYNPKEMPVVCFSACAAFDGGRTYCAYCNHDNWKLVSRLTSPKIEDREKGVIKHGQIVVAEHFHPYLIKTYHLHCALKMEILNQEEFLANQFMFMELKNNMRGMTERFLSKNPHQLVNPVFYNYLEHH